MICPYCGKDNPDNTQFCIFCGGPLAVPTEEQVTETQAVEPPASVLQPTTQSQESPITPSQPPPKPARGTYGNRIWWVVGCFLLACIILGCGVLAWGLYNITTRQVILHPATVTPTLRPAPTVVNPSKIIPSLSPNLTLIPNSLSSTPGVIFSDDFSNPNSGWDRVDQTDFYSDYFENAYRITVHSKMSDSWANPDDNVFGGVSIEVDATKNAGPDDNDFGVICRYQSTDQFYYAVISSDGYYGITKVTSASSTLIGRDSLEFSDAIHQGSATNHIRFDCLGNVLTLYVNGHQIDQQNDSDYTTGNVGLIAGTYDTPGTDILFDNFFVYQP
jgi:hypothetical protein